MNAKNDFTFIFLPSFWRSLTSAKGNVPLAHLLVGLNWFITERGNTSGSSSRQEQQHETMLMVATMKRETKSDRPYSSLNSKQKGKNKKAQTQAVWVASVWMAHAVCAQLAADWSQSFLSTLSTTPHYFYNHPVVAVQQKRPVFHRNPDALMLDCDAIVSALRREIKGRPLLQFATTFENVTVDYDVEVTPRSRSCSCATLLQSKNLMTQDLAAFGCHKGKAYWLDYSVWRWNIRTKSKQNTHNNELTKNAFSASIRPTSINKMPDSCAELKQLGYTNSGIFFVKERTWIS